MLIDPVHKARALVGSGRLPNKAFQFCDAPLLAKRRGQYCLVQRAEKGRVRADRLVSLSLEPQLAILEGVTDKNLGLLLFWITRPRPPLIAENWHYSCVSQPRTDRDDRLRRRPVAPKLLSNGSRIALLSGRLKNCTRPFE